MPQGRDDCVLPHRGESPSSNPNPGYTKFCTHSDLGRHAAAQVRRGDGHVLEHASPHGARVQAGGISNGCRVRGSSVSRKAASAARLEALRPWIAADKRRSSSACGIPSPAKPSHAASRTAQPRPATSQSMHTFSSVAISTTLRTSGIPALLIHSRTASRLTPKRFANALARDRPFGIPAMSQASSSRPANACSRG
jgi:hypothetical protein